MSGFNYCVQTYHRDTDKPGCSEVGGASELGCCLADAVRQASYYHFVCGYRVTIAITRTCEHCHGTGWIGKRAPKRCGKCDWGTIPEIAPFEYQLHLQVSEQLASV